MNPSQDAYDEAIIDSSAIEATDAQGVPVPVTIPIVLDPSVQVVYTTRLGGADGPASACSMSSCVAADANREALSTLIGLPLYFVHQVHGSNVVMLEAKHSEDQVCNDAHLASTVEKATHAEDEDPVSVLETITHAQDRASMRNDHELQDADAIVTNRSDIALAILTADCLPLLLADCQAGVIAAAHCGRKGIASGIVESTLAAMVKLGAKQENIVATLGPSICGDCYEVGADIADEFDAQLPGSFTLTRFGDPGVDLRHAVLSQLASGGVLEDHCVDSSARVRAATQYLSEDDELQEICESDGEGWSLTRYIGELRHSMCTLENPLWHSHRRAVLNGTAEGRMISLIMQRQS